jgi:hypothetical protein
MGNVRDSQGITGRMVKILDNTGQKTDAECPGNFASLSECFVVVLFTGVDRDNLVLVRIEIYTWITAYPSEQN